MFPMEYAMVKISKLSDIESKIPPPFETLLYFLAIPPSRRSQLYLTNNIIAVATNNLFVIVIYSIALHTNPKNVIQLG